MTSNAAAPRRSADTASLPALQTNTGHQRSPTPSSLQQSDVDTSRPKDFEGEVETDDALPGIETVRALQDHLVLDKEGKTRTFRSLYDGKNSARRVLVVFIRHFFCGVCDPGDPLSTPFAMLAWTNTGTRTARTTSAPSVNPSPLTPSSVSPSAPRSSSSVAAIQA